MKKNSPIHQHSPELRFPSSSTRRQASPRSSAPPGRGAPVAVVGRYGAWSSRVRASRGAAESCAGRCGGAGSGGELRGRGGAREKAGDRDGDPQFGPAASSRRRRRGKVPSSSLVDRRDPRRPAKSVGETAGSGEREVSRVSLLVLCFWLSFVEICPTPRPFCALLRSPAGCVAPCLPGESPDPVATVDASAGPPPPPMMPVRGPSEAGYSTDSPPFPPLFTHHRRRPD